MVKTVIKEIIITLLLCLAILLILAVLLYSYIPSNKVVPEIVAYKIPEEAKEVIDEATEDTSKVILSYEINSSDINSAQRANVYNPGKVDPFAAYEAPTNETAGGTTGSSSGTTSGTTGNTSGSATSRDTEGYVNGSTTGGSGTYYTNNGSK